MTAAEWQELAGWVLFAWTLGWCSGYFIRGLEKLGEQL